jgi:hypothetical protein
MTRGSTGTPQEILQSRRAAGAQQLTPEGAIIETFELDGIPPYNDDDLVANPPAVERQAGGHNGRGDRRTRHRSNAISPAAVLRFLEHVSAQSTRGDDHQLRPAFRRTGKLVDEPTRDLMRKFLQALVLWTRQVAHGKQIQA